MSNDRRSHDRVISTPNICHCWCYYSLPGFWRLVLSYPIHFNLQFQQRFTQFPWSKLKNFLIKTCVNSFYQEKKSKWLQLDSNPEPLSSYTNTHPSGQTGQMIELCSEYLSVRCIWLYVLVMLRTRFRVNPHSKLKLQISDLNFSEWLKLQFSRLLRARSSLTFRQL